MSDAAQRWQRVSDLVARAAELPRDEAEALIAAEAGDDPGLQEEVRALLGHADEADAFLGSLAERMGAGRPLELPDTDGAEIPERIGPYRVISELGRGGMGVVYLAERDDPRFRQTVAIKRLAAHLGGDAGERRFVAERQILARLEHPGIARLLDGGVEQGRPYLAMEYVEGEPLDRHVAQRNPGLEARLGLFLQVCEAVGYAHRNLIVHRDLKPNNVHVTADGTVKLLDFGIAKLLDPEAPDFLRTQEGPESTPLTPAFAGPEQITGEPISTATDVYALGILLCILTTGRLPYRVRPSSRAELERHVLRDGALPLSRLSNEGAEGVDPDHPIEPLPARLLRGDLEAIAARGLRKEPEHRYASALELAADIRRFLECRPVHARRGTLRYRTGRFLRRHRVAVGVTAALAAVGIAGAGAFQWNQWRHAQRLADERARAERVADLLVDVLRISEPGARAPEDIEAHELLRWGSERVRRELGNEPEVQAELLQSIGRIYLQLGRSEEAAATLETALSQKRETRAPPLEIADLLEQLGEARLKQGQPREAVAPLQEALELRRREQPASSHVAATLLQLGTAWEMAADYDAAEPLLDEALTLFRSREAPDDVSTAAVLFRQASLRHHRNDFNGALDLWNQAAAIYRETGDTASDEYVAILGMLGTYHAAMRNWDEAIATYEEKRRVAEGRFGAESPQAASALYQLASTANLAGRIDDIGPTAEKALAIQREHGDPFAIAQSEQLLGRYHLMRGRNDQAVALSRSALDGFAQVRGEEDPVTTNARRQLARALRLAGRPEDALAQIEQSRRVLERIYGADNVMTLDAQVEKARTFATLGRDASAERLIRDAVERYPNTLREGHPRLAGPLMVWGRFLLDRERGAEALDPLSRAFPLTSPTSNLRVYTRCARMLAEAHEADGNPAEAERIRSEARRRIGEIHGSGHDAIAYLDGRLSGNDF
ncbi:hypothetical protein ABI59_23605 [Acidobacteria bacterium Mor1]|nr:hypothetical protein ABI59_23605 [Acidobacteria bacterium Mor1]